MVKWETSFTVSPRPLVIRTMWASRCNDTRHALTYFLKRHHCSSLPRPPIHKLRRRRVFHRQAERFEQRDFLCRPAAGLAANDHFAQLGPDVLGPKRPGP